MTRRSPRTEQSGSPPLFSRRSPAKNSFSTFVGALRPCSSATVSNAPSDRIPRHSGRQHSSCTLPAWMLAISATLKTMPHVSPKDRFRRAHRRRCTPVKDTAPRAKAPPASGSPAKYPCTRRGQTVRTQLKSLVKHHHAMPRRTDISCNIPQQRRLPEDGAPASSSPRLRSTP